MYTENDRGSTYPPPPAEYVGALSGPNVRHRLPFKEQYGPKRRGHRSLSFNENENDPAYALPTPGWKGDQGNKMIAA